MRTTITFWHSSISLLFTLLISTTQSASSDEGVVVNKSNVSFSIERFNLNQLPYSVQLSSSCRESISTRERTCYAKYLDRFDGFEVKSTGIDSSPVITEDVSSEFERKICCAIWQWHSCTSPSFNHQACTVEDWAHWVHFPHAEASVTYLCAGYEYDSLWCWPFPLWTYIAFAIFIVLLLSAGILGVIWFWRKGSAGRRKGEKRVRAYRHEHKKRQNEYV